MFALPSYGGSANNRESARRRRRLLSDVSMMLLFTSTATSCSCDGPATHLNESHLHFSITVNIVSLKVPSGH